MGKSGKQPPAGSVTIGDQKDGKHTEGRNASAVGQIDKFHHAEDRGERQHDRAFGETKRPFLFHRQQTPFLEWDCSAADTSEMQKSLHPKVEGFDSSRSAAPKRAETQ